MYRNITEGLDIFFYLTHSKRKMLHFFGNEENFRKRLTILENHCTHKFERLRAQNLALLSFKYFFSSSCGVVGSILVFVILYHRKSSQEDPNFRHLAVLLSWRMSRGIHKGLRRPVILLTSSSSPKTPKTVTAPLGT